MKLVILDGYSINPGDLSWAPIEAIAAFHSFDRSKPEEIIDHIGNSDGFFVSNCEISRQTMEACPNLKFIGVTATGYDHVDIEAAKELGIAVCHVPAYSTEAVAQHTFALILELTNLAGRYNAAVQRGRWYESIDFTFNEGSLMLLDGKSLGIIGYGNIGKRVARIAEAFGMKVNVYSHDRDAALKSDIVSLHCPLTSDNEGFVDRDFLSQMKDGALLINTARGALVNEIDLADALKRGKLAAAALDVISGEPPAKPHPLIGLPNCLLTPHIAWMPRETRQKVINTCADNLNSFLCGGNLNRIV